MRSAITIATCAIFCALGLSAGDTSAATSTKSKASAAKSQASKAQGPKSARSTKGKSGKSAPKSRPIAPPPPELSQTQLNVSQLVQIGRAQCEFDQTVLIEPDPTHFGAFTLSHQKKTYKMVPEETATGAVRLQDAEEGIVWIQIPVKSMLMNMNLGQRLVDACTQPAQRTAQSEADARRARAAAARLQAPVPAPSADGTLPPPPPDQPGESLPLLRN